MSTSQAACDDLRLSLGAYVLGTLEPADHETVRRHVAGCAECSAQVDEFAAIVPMLAEARPAAVEAGPPSDELFGRIVAAIDATPPAVETTPPAVETISARAKVGVHGPRRWLLVAAACAALLVAGGVAVGVAVSSSGSGSTSASATSHGVHLQVTATDASSGTLLDIRVDGLPKNEHCRLVATQLDGSRHEAGSWDATYGGHAEVSETTAVPRSQLRRLTLYGNHSRRLIAINL